MGVPRLGDKTFKSPFGSDNWSSVNLVKLSLHGTSLAEPCPGVLRTVHARFINISQTLFGDILLLLC